jgi:hypothetical protein
MEYWWPNFSQAAKYMKYNANPVRMVQTQITFRIFAIFFY